MRKKILERKLQRLTEKRESLKQKALASTDVNEVRSLNALIEEVNADIEDVNDELAFINEEEQRSATPPADAQRVNANFGGGSFQQSGSQQRSEESPLETMEYRRAFREFILRGTPVPMTEIRNGETITTQTTAPAIPLTIMNEVINTVRVSYGNLYAKVRKLSVPGGVEFPIGALRATFKWINEGEVSPRQKVDNLGKISFGYHTAEIRLSQTFLANLVTLSAFERELSTVIAEAYLEAMDYGIVNGSGNGTMTGILNDARVTNVITMTAAQMNDWMEWRKRFFAKLPLKYRAGEFIFPLSTVETYLETMHDSMNNPIFRQATGLVVNDGDARDPNGTFFGRRISLVEPDIIEDFDTASAGDVIGIFWQPDQYAINENFGFTMRRYFDEETNEWVDKALTVVDGKVLNPVGYYLIKKAAT